MKEFKTREELLQDSINYYWGKPERQCLSDGGRCQYTATSTSEGCAIGRLVTPELAAELDKGSGTSKVFTVIHQEVFERLPEWLRSLGREFLTKLQALHDTSNFVKRQEDAVIDAMKNYVDMSKITYPEI